MKKSKLVVELVPKTCWFSNIRTMVTKKEWDKIRHLSYANANNVCEICGEIGKNQGYKHNLECHEIWKFNKKTKTQHLIGLISLCPDCHLVKHFGRAKAMGIHEKCYNKLMVVNNWTIDQTLKHIDAAFVEYAERSKNTWLLDITLLNKEPYNLNINPLKKRVFKIKKYKKKRKKKKRTK